MSSVIITDANYTTAATQIADAARHSLLLIQYLFVISPTPSHPVYRIARSLIYAADRGVQIRILLNRFSHGRARGSPGPRPPEELRHPNIDLRYHTSGVVLHSKIIVADAETVLTGSHNLSHWTLTRSHNLSILIVDTDVASRILAVYNPMFEKAKRAAS